jgi:hypothetical protein
VAVTSSHTRSLKPRCNRHRQVNALADQRWWPAHGHIDSVCLFRGICTGVPRDGGTASSAAGSRASGKPLTALHRHCLADCVV